MQKRLSPSVKINYFDKEKVLSALHQFVKSISRNPEITKIILFGSLLYDRCVPGSDVDLLIILKDSKKPLLERIPGYTPAHFPCGIDVFPYTEKEINNMLKGNNLFIKRALEQGKTLYTRG